MFAKAMTATAALLKQCQVRNGAHANRGTATGTRHKYDSCIFSQVKISYSQRERNLILGIKINTEQTRANAKSGKPVHTVYDSKA